MKRGVYSLILLVLVLGLTSYMDLGFNIKDITGLVIQENNQIPIEQNNNPILTFFCPRDHCADQLIYLIKKSNKIDCAFFELDHPDIISALSKKDHRLVIDGNYKEEVPTTFNAKFDTTKQFSHNKFCIFDNKIVWTGSMNPTVNGDEKNNNNVVVVESTVLAQNYNKEFEQLWSGVFGATKEAQDIQHELVVNNITLENYFCPEDNCADEIVSELQKAQQSIVFMTFAFTHKDILATFLERQQQGVKIAGVFEKRQNSKYSNYQPLLDAGAEVTWDNNKATMHHKFFVIDGKTVITGSMNPSNNGNTRNDENVLIIHDEGIAGSFVNELLLHSVD